MGINVALEDENGKEIVFVGEPIGDPIACAIRKAPGARLPWASTIDPYGDTTFNYIQAKNLRREWAVLIEEAEDDKTRDVLLQVDAILQRCVSDRLYVKFYGD